MDWLNKAIKYQQDEDAREYIETILTDNLITNNDLIKHEIKNRNMVNYFGDGIFTNNTEDMKNMMIKNKIPLTFNKIKELEIEISIQEQINNSFSN